MENLETALLLMFVGMSTVFVILFLVIGLGKGLIALVNTYAPAEIPVKGTAAASAVAPSLAGAETAAIVAAVSAVTAGQGKVTKIEKV